jgi:hypothetical protein
VLEAGDSFYDYKSFCQVFILDIVLKGHAEKLNTEVNSCLRKPLGSHGFYFLCHAFIILAEIPQITDEEKYASIH